MDKFPKKGPWHINFHTGDVTFCGAPRPSGRVDPPKSVDEALSLLLQLARGTKKCKFEDVNIFRDRTPDEIAERHEMGPKAAQRPTLCGSASRLTRPNLQQMGIGKDTILSHATLHVR